MTNAQKFLQCFNNIENHLKKSTNSRSGDSFGRLLSESRDKNGIVRKYYNELNLFRELRNSLVHQSVDWSPIAEPHDEAVKRIEKIAELLINPPKVTPEFQFEVATVSTDDEISKALKMMYSGEYSQLPVTKDGKCIDLLTANTFSRWLGANIEEELAIIEGTTIAEVLEYKEGIENFKFIPRSTTLVEAYKMFENLEDHRAPLDALLITHNGKAHEGLMGIITHYDIPDIMAKI